MRAAAEANMPRVLDLRGLEPPEPLKRSLEASAQLHEGEELLVVTDRRPVHLLPILEERGFRLATNELADRHETRVSRPPRASA